MSQNKKYIHMSETEKQNTPLPNEVTPENAFTKLSISAMHAADRYKLKSLKINEKSSKK